MRHGRWKVIVAAIAALVFLCGPWLLAGLSHASVLERSSAAVYRWVYGPLVMMFSPYSRAVEEHVLHLSSPAMADSSRTPSFPRVGRGVLVILYVGSTAFLAVLGGSVGSFLNVVVYRLPRSMGITQPGSHCPGCEHPIRPGDNIPVFGWLRLHGRCRDCNAPIAPRYPLVEGATMLLFLLLAFVELYTSGANLPLRSAHSSWSIASLEWSEGDAPGMYLFHACLLSVLLANALIDWDGFAPPTKLVATGLGVGLALPLIGPTLRPVPILVPPPAWHDTSSWLGGGADGAAGLVVGCVIGFLVALGAGKFDHASRRPSLAFALALTGAYLGWQSAIAIGLIAAVAQCILSFGAFDKPRFGSWPGSATALLATLVHILCWRWTSAVPWWPGPGGGAAVFAVAVALTVIAALLTRRLRSRLFAEAVAAQA